MRRETMKVAVAYAEDKRQVLLNLEVADGTTAEGAIQQSGILARYPGIDLGVNKIGIFSKLVPLAQPLSEGDRVEIYRPALGKPPKKERAAKGAAGAEEGADEA
ncbi:MAG: RnfH family protein [Magnetococcales bacterium]|nr:RnfH family protein [Magnetococcales bacterium]